MLTEPPAAALAELTAGMVAATIIGGGLVYFRGCDRAQPAGARAAWRMAVFALAVEKPLGDWDFRRQNVEAVEGARNDLDVARHASRWSFGVGQVFVVEQVVGAHADPRRPAARLGRRGARGRRPRGSASPRICRPPEADWLRVFHSR